jgi:hypothetical protein
MTSPWKKILFLGKSQDSLTEAILCKGQSRSSINMGCLTAFPKVTPGGSGSPSAGAPWHAEQPHSIQLV